MYGLIGAMSVEVEALMNQLTDRQEKKIGMDVFVSGRLFGKDAVLAVCGPGKVNAALCTQSMILHYQPEWILNLGVAGAGDTTVAIGDMVVATAAVQHDMDTSPIGDPVGLVSKINLVEIPCDASLRAYHADAIAIALPAAEDDALMRQLMTLHPDLPVMEAPAMRGDVELRALELRKLLIRLNSDVSNDNYTISDQMMYCRHEYFRVLMV